MILVRVHEHDHPVSHRVEDFPCAIGRSMHAQIRIDEQTVSGRHAEIRRDGDALVLVDLGSTNGILEGGKRVQELRLTANVTVHFGDVRVELIVEEQLSPTKLSRPAKARLPASARTAVPKVMAAVILSYVAVCLVPASDRYKEYWPPERPYEILGSALAIWLALLGMAFVISLFCKINSKRFRFHQVMALTRKVL